MYLPSLGWDTEQQRPSLSGEGHGFEGVGLERVVGGVELSARFAHSEDLNRVLAAAKSVGWEAPASLDGEFECEG